MKQLYIITIFLFSLTISKVCGQTGPDCQDIGITDPVNFVTGTTPMDVFPGDQFCMEIEVENFEFVIGFQYTFTFDPTKLEYIDWFQNMGSLTGQIFANTDRAANGIIVFIWTNANSTGQTLPDGTSILNICFEVIGEPCACAPIGFNSDLAPGFPATEVNYQIDAMNQCSDSLLLIDGNQDFSCIQIQCLDLSIINLGICNSTSSSERKITFEVCGGTPPYSYEVSDGAVTFPGMTTPFTLEEIRSLPAGTYTITVRDDAGTMVTETVSIISEPGLDFEFEATNPPCDYIQTGEINVRNYSGGTPNYTVSGVNGLVFQDTLLPVNYEGLASGVYEVTVEDDMGCSVTQEVTIFTPPLDYIIEIDSSTCEGSTDGRIRIIPSGGTPFAGGEYNIGGNLGTEYETLEPFQDIFYLDFLEVWRVDIEDANGCIERVEIEVPFKDSISYEPSVQDVMCKGDSTGTFILTNITPGPFNQYFFPLFDQFGNLVTTDIAVGGIRNDSLIYDATLSAGSYLIQIISSTSGCMQEFEFVIGEPVSEIMLTPDFTAPSCNADDGQAMVIAFGGTAPLSYSWADDPAVTTITLANVGAGMYEVTVTDDLGCTAAITIEVESGGFIDMEAAVFTGLGCDNMGTGQLSVTINNSTSPPLSFEWFDNDDMSIGNAQSQSITSPGEYYVEVITADCTQRDTVNLDPGSGFTFDITIANPTCPTFNNGTIIIENLMGGSAPYDFAWDIIPFSGPNPIGLSEADYTVTITDIDGCEQDTLISLANETTEITFGIVITEPDCPGAETGSFEITNIMGGVDPYTCVWEDPLITTCNPMDLPAGRYNFSIMDDRGCESRDTFAILTDPASSITFDATVNNPICGGGLGDIDISNLNGTQPVNLSWADDMLAGSFRSDLDADDYTLTITDGDGCSIDTTFSLIRETDNFLVDINANVPECPNGIDGSISLTNCIGCTCEWEDPSLDAQGCDLVSLSPGIYRVTITDMDGCELDTFADLTVTDTFQIELANITQAQCFEGNDGRATVSVTNDPRMVGTYSYIWSNGDMDVDEIEATNTQLQFGDNFVVGFDGTCSDTLEFVIDSPDDIFLDLANTTTMMTSCNGGCDGMASLEATGGTMTSGSYGYVWEDGIDAQMRDDLCAGINYVTITDDNGCEKIDSILILEPDVLEIDTLTLLDVSCFDPNSGQIEVTVDGGCDDYMYEWTDDVSDNALALNLASGDYVVTVTDGCGCTATADFTLQSSSMMDVVPLMLDAPNCVGQTVDIGIDNVTGGVGNNYTYSVNFGDRLPIDSLDANFPGDYTLTVFDEVGCSESVSVTIPQPQEFSVDLGPDITVSLGAGDASINAGVIGGADPLTYAWNSESPFDCVDADCSMIDIVATTFANYQVLVIDDNGCEATDDINVEVKTERNVYIPNTFSPSAPAPNDRLMLLTGLGVEMLNYFRIYDRWGNLMYEVENVPAPTTIDMGWDGRKGDSANSEVESGVYVYVAEVQFLDNANTIVYSGSITLIR